MKFSSNFQTGLKSIVRGELLVAPLRAYLQSPDFPGFDIHIDGVGKREWDGFFHPSEHPLMNERSLYLYLTNHEALTPEVWDPTAILSMTAGSIWHAIVNKRILHEELGLLSAVEIPVAHPETRAKGSMDGLVSTIITPDGKPEAYELKTMKDAILARVDSVEVYLAANPGYHVQANEYMRLSGIWRIRVLLMSLTFPYAMREFVIEYDPELAQRTERKYRKVIQAAADGRMPMCDGCFKGNTCPARGFCREEFGLR